MSEKRINVRRDRIIVPEFAERPADKVKDDLLRNSIKQSGIEQPLVLVPDGNTYLLAKGLRRLERAAELEIEHVPAVVEQPPDGVDPLVHARRLRFILVHNRQDLLPSQKCEFVLNLKTNYGLTNREIAAYTGMAIDSVSNWLAVKQYLPPIVAAMDHGHLTMNAARTFDGMSEEGQRTLWKRHAKELCGKEGGAMHKALRAKYPPANYPRFYKDPELIAKRLAAPKASTRKGTARTGMSAAEKARKTRSLETLEIEVRDNERKLKRFELEIEASIVPISGILRSAKLRKMIPAQVLEELEAFAEGHR